MGAADPLQQGSLLAERYRIGERIGAGGMASVHRCTDETLGREVAIKAIVRDPTDEAELARERSEIDLLATLNHRALVTLFDAGTTTLDGRLVTYLVMELVAGPTLASQLAQGALRQEHAWRIAHDLAEALVIVHASGVVHRDIKPANILLAPTIVPGRDFDVKLADFGIAAIVGAARLTATGTVLGTAAYLSPEQATGAAVEPSSDIYSLGLVLLEGLTGNREYPGPLLESLSARLARDPVIPGSVGYEWKSLLTGMTAREPGARPTAAQVLERLIEMAAAAATTGDIDATAALGSAATAMMTAPATAAGAPERGATGETLVSAALGAPADAQATDPARGRRRRWALAGGLAAGVAMAVAVPAMAMQEQDPAPATTAETTAPTVVAPAPTEAAPVETAPATETAEPEVAPAVPASVTTDGSTGGTGSTSGGDGSSSSGSSTDAGSGNGAPGSTGAESSGNENAGPGNGGSRP